ncbi:hypothetical protein BKA58DRAFT_440562 [Alternaria rosae]|uniref:uncharacterized protein n=1 Tax=Alternaria rosae TaxID=1187941 RepID=UPI001E8D9BB6|nr:uncharacterized protein BKA58DRAFT_440562 [Alternaria rosae]KAH6868103.1 hypothetical protein BKA58DRAFT_440562 [Alternaria rosae]
MPGQPGYPVYHPNQGQPEETPAPAGYGSFTHTSPTSTSVLRPGSYQYIGDFASSISQPMNSQAFVSGAIVNINAAPTANTYFVAQSGSAFTPSNQSANAITTPTISPSQTQFDPTDASQFYEDDNNDDAKKRCDSLYPKEEEASPTTTATPSTKRRRSEYAEPGSARAIYLEKNRKAASKCRSKQKMEQEALVEKARVVERSNRMLKAEVHMLQTELRELKEYAGRHANCRDPRIAIYLQRLADRLASQLGLPPQHL